MNMKAANNSSATSPGIPNLAPADTDELRWQAVVARSAAADGEFIYAVLSTGVYCRPSCPSRQARRDNMRFFDNMAAAEQAGFRPCKRCRPTGASPQEQQQQRIAALCQWIQQAEHLPNLQQLAEHAQLSPHYLHRLFKQALGITPKAYTSALRQQRLQAGLGQAVSVTEAAYAAGFDSSSTLYNQAALGMAPASYRDGGRAQQITYAIAPCPLGQVLVAMSSKGICAVLLGDDPQQLAADLHQRFPAAACLQQDAALHDSVSAVIQLIEQPHAGIKLPLDIRGTAFQQRVWQALQRIPPGETRSYREVAISLNAPNAVRAVAGACAANPLALLVPCHRVIRSDGALSGYRWGLERKQQLLTREARESADA